MNLPVKFPIAELLKEKGFNEKVRGRINVSHFHLVKDGIIPININTYYEDMFAPIDNWNSDKTHFMSLPNIAEVVMWLYKKHGLWIEISLTDNSKHFYFDYVIITSNDRDYNDEDCFDSAKRIYGKDKHGSPTEAYEAAIKYALNNLI